jgi:hypothetical protein
MHRRGRANPGNNLLDRAAGHKLAKQETGNGNPKHRRDHQKKTPNDVSGHWP